MTGATRAPFTSKDVRAVRALYAGEASPEEQKIAMKWILDHASGVKKPSFVAGEDGRRETDFNEGSKWVGSQIVFLIDGVNLQELVKEEEKEKPNG